MASKTSNSNDGCFGCFVMSLLAVAFGALIHLGWRLVS